MTDVGEPTPRVVPSSRQMVPGGLRKQSKQAVGNKPVSSVLLGLFFSVNLQVPALTSLSNGLWSGVVS